MEIFILLLMAVLAGFWWVNHTMKKKEEKLKEETVDNNQAPYKVEVVEPKTEVVVNEAVAVAEVAKPVEPTKCGCSRSPTGFCVGLHKLSAEEWAVHADNPQKKVNEQVVQDSVKEVKRTRKPKTVKVEKEVATKKPRGRKPNLEKSVKPNAVPKKKAVPKKSTPAAKKPRAKKAQ